MPKLNADEAGNPSTPNSFKRRSSLRNVALCGVCGPPPRPAAVAVVVAEDPLGIGECH